MLSSVLSLCLVELKSYVKTLLIPQIMSDMNDTTFLPIISSLPPSRLELGLPLHPQLQKLPRNLFCSKTDEQSSEALLLSRYTNKLIHYSLSGPAEVVVKLQFDVDLQTKLSHAGQLSWKCQYLKNSPTETHLCCFNTEICGLFVKQHR